MINPPYQLFTLIFVVAILGGCSATKTTHSPEELIEEYSDAGSDYLIDEYLLGVGDLLKINVWRNEDLSVDITILPDGNVSLPLVGQVKAAGETTESLGAFLKEKLEKYLKQPEVTVSVVSAVSSEYLQRVRISGAVASPQSLPYRRGMTVLDLVLQAGGTTPFASANRAILYREGDKELKAFPVHLDDILRKGNLRTNYKLLPSDIVAVPESNF